MSCLNFLNLADCGNYANYANCVNLANYANLANIVCHENQVDWHDVGHNKWVGHFDIKSHKGGFGGIWRFYFDGHKAGGNRPT